ncbi:MAG: hypothetical protein KVP17_002397 [Porospora cf. gigantea B]|uniref:uncharacterized protein n=1 Tax=Porospora cf. gigantea B TaxID=2853592 RepID=UPI003571EEC0|nr:MAG: hypothetical protein KVP17_002397 [Porospora cf. gigantea B]
MCCCFSVLCCCGNQKTAFCSLSVRHGVRLAGVLHILCIAGYCAYTFVALSQAANSIANAVYQLARVASDQLNAPLCSGSDCLNIINAFITSNLVVVKVDLALFYAFFFLSGICLVSSGFGGTYGLIKAARFVLEINCSILLLIFITLALFHSLLTRADDLTSTSRASGLVVIHQTCIALIFTMFCYFLSMVTSLQKIVKAGGTGTEFMSYRELLEESRVEQQGFDAEGTPLLVVPVDGDLEQDIRLPDSSFGVNDESP